MHPTGGGKKAEIALHFLRGRDVFDARQSPQNGVKSQGLRGWCDGFSRQWMAEGLFPSLGNEGEFAPEREHAGDKDLVSFKEMKERCHPTPF